MVLGMGFMDCEKSVQLLSLKILSKSGPSGMLDIATYAWQVPSLAGLIMPEGHVFRDSIPANKEENERPR